MAPGRSCWRSEEAGIVLAVRLTPRGGRDAVEGIGALADGREVVLARVRAAPTEGEANRALVALLAKALGVAKSAVTIAAGQAARRKEVRIAGDPAALAARVEAWRRQS
jgi:hypothetical protein